MEIMSFKNVGFSYSYETGKDDPVNDFYLPLLAEAVSYDRIAGYFSSASLAIAARGIAGLISNHGVMRIITCPRLSEEDIKIIHQVVGWPDKFLEQRIIDDISTIEDEFQRDHLKALGWMLSKGFLEMRLAVVVEEKTDKCAVDSIFHQKIGVLRDYEGNQVSFSGSINETAMGWLFNVEEFKVFKGWEIGQEGYLQSDVQRFEEFWNGKRKNVRIYSLPNAVAEKLIKIGQDFSLENFVAKKYIRAQKEKSIEEKINLYFYQKEALDKWKGNNYQLLFEMATGTGKTRTAIACIFDVMSRQNKLLAIIACPQNTLSRQWKTEIEAIGLNFDNALIVDSSNHKWRNEVENELKNLAIGFHQHSIIYTTHMTASSDDFIGIIKKHKRDTAICFIGDEAHGLGAYKTKQALLDEYQYRIGLSATPSRWFDDYGSAILQKYFGNLSFQFTISDALLTVNPSTNEPFLIEYEYHPIFIKLTDEEFGKYIQLTTRIKKMASYRKNSDEYQKRLESLLFARSDIEKNAENKYAALREILTLQKINNTIIFVDDGQIDQVMHILKDFGIIAHRFTQSEGTKGEVRYEGLSERQYLIKKFKDNSYQALVAIKCLDEGIDIPSADTAIIMASSTNPREYVQRVGRVIRQSKGKRRAHIYDFILEPDLERIKDPSVIELERNIFNKEMVRVKDMSSNSINNADVLVELNTRIGRIINGS
jgi:superfamily II DNA or RNA helicase